MDILAIAGQKLSLSRWPVIENDQLRAWDAADEYLLDETAKHENPVRVLVLNDGFGALACGLTKFNPVLWSDSIVTRKAVDANLSANSLPVIENQQFVPMHQSPGTEVFDLILIKVPRSLALLDYQLKRLRSVINAETRIVAGAMLKYLPKAAIELFEKHIGPCTTSLAKKKARLIFASPEKLGANPGTMVSTEQPQGDVSLAADDSGKAAIVLRHVSNPALALPENADYQLFDGALSIGSHPGVFSHGKLDVGSRFFLEHFPKLPQANSAIDLACGNGVLGLALQYQRPDMQLSFCDESYLAIDASRQNFQRAFTPKQYQQTRFDVMDCLAGIDNNSVELIICNPPFHQQNAVNDQIAKRMFNDAHRCLQRSGQLWIVANRHLAYHVTLKRRFGNCQVVASNKKFVVLRVVKR